VRWSSFLIVVLLGSACTGSSTPEVRTPAVPVPPSAAIVSLVTAEGVGEDGAPVSPSAVFASDAHQIAAVASIGQLSAEAGSTLVVRWLQMDEGARIPLFEHQITVHSGDRAYSIGVSTGELAPGHYRIEAELEGETSIADVMVLPAAAGGGTALGSVSGIGAVGPLLGAGVLLQTRDAGPQPPESGDSGAVPATPPATGSGTGCVLTLQTSGDPYVILDSTGCTGDGIVGAAGPEGGPLTVIDHVQGDNIRFWNADPCRVGASDLPESKIEYTAEVVRGPHKGTRRDVTTQIGADKTAPSIVVDATPEVGSLALEGSSISMTVTATDPHTNAEGGSGIASITVVDGAGKTLAERTFGDEPTACDQSRFEKSVQATTTVPTGDAPYTVTVTATDFAGSTTQLQAAWPTHAQIVGFLVAKTTATVPGNSCKSVWHATFELPISALGPVEGGGVATPLSPPRCTAGFVGPGPQEFNFRWQGTFDGKSFKLTFLPEGGPGGFEGGFHLMYYPAPPPFVIPFNGTSGTIDINLSNSGPEELAGGGGTASIDGWIELHISTDS
jgi:hypothetical protein